VVRGPASSWCERKRASKDDAGHLTTTASLEGRRRTPHHDSEPRRTTPDTSPRQRASKDDGPNASAASFEGRSRGHLRMTDHRSGNLVLAMRPTTLVIARSASDEAIQSGTSAWIASRHDVALAMTSRSRGATKHPRHCEEHSDEAIQYGISVWIASRHFVALAMTSRSRSASARPRLWHVSHVNRHHRFYAVLHAKLQQANAGGSTRKRRLARMTERKNG
jgi:hypothetical protein